MEDEVKGKRPIQDNPSSASATDGTSKLCIHRLDLMDDEEELEQIDFGKDEMLYGGNYLCFEGNKLFVVGKRPPAVMRRFGPPPPNALTHKRMRRRMAETGLSYIRGDDPVFAINWNPFPVAKYSSPTPAATTADASDIEA